MKNETLHLQGKGMQVIASTHLKNQDLILGLIQNKIDRVLFDNKRK